MFHCRLQVISRIFKAFAYRDFRIMWFGACTSSIGTLMQTFAQAWLVLQLTNSPFLLGLDSFLGSIPIVLFSLVGGVFADRTERQKLLLGSQFVQMACAFTLARLVRFRCGEDLADTDPLVRGRHGAILRRTGLLGADSNAGENGGSAQRDRAELDSVQCRARTGPNRGRRGAELLGASWCFGLNGVSFVAVIISLLIIHPHFVPTKSRESVLTSMKEGIHFIRNQAAMEALIVLAFMMTLLAFPLIVFLPVFAKDVFHGGPKLYTIFLVCSGIGSICGALTVAGLGNINTWAVWCY